MTEPQQQPQKKKGLSPIAWVAIGCGAILVIGALAVTAGGLFVAKKAKDFIEDVEADPIAATAETIIKLNPELELVESDREGGKITVREKSSGKVVTFNYEDIESGRFSFENEQGETTATVDVSADSGRDAGVLTITTDEGTATYGATGAAVELPDWLPDYSGSSSDVGGFSSVTSESRSGSYFFQTTDASENVLEFYEGVMEELGLEVSRTSFSGGGSSVVSVSGRSDEYTISATVTDSAEGRQVNVTYQGPA